MADLDKMTFADLRPSEAAELSRLLSRREGQKEVLDALVQYLAMWNSAKWIDNEKLHYLGVDIRRLIPPGLETEFESSIRNAISDNVAKVFLTGFESAVRQRTRVSAPPPLSRLNDLLRHLREAQTTEVIKEAETLLESYAGYTRASGNPAPFIRAVSQLCPKLTSTAESLRRSACGIAAKFSEDALNWAPGNSTLWVYWGRSLAKLGAFEPAELVVWEAVRRFPWNQHLRSHLLQIVGRRKKQLPQAIRLARDFIHLFPDNAVLRVQLATFQIRTGDTTEIVAAVEDVVNSLVSYSEQKSVVFELTAAASALVALTANGSLDEQFLDKVVSLLIARPKYLSGVIRRLLDHHKAYKLAQALCRAWLSFSSDDPRTWGQLARTYLVSDADSDIREALDVLRRAHEKFPTSAPIRNQFARALAQTGKVKDRELAIEYLLKTIREDPLDLYAPNQLASIHVSGPGMSGREEAIKVLETAIANNIKNQYARNFLEELTNRPGSLAHISVQVPVFEPTQKSEEAETAGIDDLIAIPELKRVPSELVPEEILHWGATRRMSYDLKHGSSVKRKQARAIVSEIILNQPTEYELLLGIREGFYHNRIDPAVSFALSFEQALADKNLELLQILGWEYPKYEVLSAAARAALGDDRPTESLSRLLDEAETSYNPAVSGLKRVTLSSISQLATNDQSQLEVLSLVRDANEAALRAPSLVRVP